MLNYTVDGIIGNQFELQQWHNAFSSKIIYSSVTISLHILLYDILDNKLKQQNNLIEKKRQKQFTLNEYLNTKFYVNIFARQLKMFIPSTEALNPNVEKMLKLIKMLFHCIN